MSQDSDNARFLALEAAAACAEHNVTGCAVCFPETYGVGGSADR